MSSLSRKGASLQLTSTSLLSSWYDHSDLQKPQGKTNSWNLRKSRKFQSTFEQKKVSSHSQKKGKPKRKKINLTKSQATLKGKEKRKVQPDT